MQSGEKPSPNRIKHDDNDTEFPELAMAPMLRYRVRYGTGGAVIGS